MRNLIWKRRRRPGRLPYSPWSVAQVSLAGVALVLLAVAVAAVAVPVRIERSTALLAAPAELPDSLASGTGPADRSEVQRRLAGVMRQGLFKPATPQRDKPMADQTIQRILSSLKLQCVIQIAGQPVAYIHVKDSGLRKCRVGEGVSDLFTVLSIGERSVEISILDHRTVLEL